MAMTCFQIGTVLCRPVAGRIIDGVNKQKLLFGASLLFFLLMAGFYFASGLHVVWFLRLIHGAVFALGTTASAAMAALVLPRRRKGRASAILRCAAIWPWSSVLWWGSSLWIIWAPIPSLFSLPSWRWERWRQEMGRSCPMKSSFRVEKSGRASISAIS